MRGCLKVGINKVVYLDFWFCRNILIVNDFGRGFYEIFGGYGFGIDFGLNSKIMGVGFII